MKYSIIALLSLGAVSITEAHQSKSLTQLNAAGIEDVTNVQTGWQGWEMDDGIIDTLTPPKPECEPRLWVHPSELQWQMDQFSRKFNIQNYKNAMFIAAKLGSAPPKVHAWELNDAAFSFPRVRRYDVVQSNMDMLEHFQDNLNQNLSNLKNVDNLIRVGKTVVANFNAKYHEGEYADPGAFDPREVPEQNMPEGWGE